MHNSPTKKHDSKLTDVVGPTSKSQRSKLFKSIEDVEKNVKGSEADEARVGPFGEGRHVADEAFAKVSACVSGWV